MTTTRTTGRRHLARPKDQLKAFVWRVPCVLRARSQPRLKRRTRHLRRGESQRLTTTPQPGGSWTRSIRSDVKALRAVIRIRSQDADERKEHEAILETYLHALGMI